GGARGAGVRGPRRLRLPPPLRPGSRPPFSCFFSRRRAEPIPFPSPVLPVRRALLSVHDKAGITELARELAARGVTLVSTGGTAAHLKQSRLTVSLVAEETGFSEILGGLVH